MDEETLPAEVASPVAELPAQAAASPPQPAAVADPEATPAPAPAEKPDTQQEEITAIAPDQSLEAPMSEKMTLSLETAREAPLAAAPPPAAIQAESPAAENLAAEGEAKQEESKVADPTTSLAPGFRFHPTDEELVSYYLKRKVMNKPARYNAIGETDIYAHDPWELEVFSRLKTRDQEWFFFSMMDKRYGNRGKMSRTTKAGYWKTTGKDREISRGFSSVGFKKTLVFHKGRAPDGNRTNWVMHEYRLSDSMFHRFNVHAEYYVLCRVFLKSSAGPPNANRYAPFMEEEWDEDDAAGGLIPANDLRDDSNQKNQPVTRLIDLNEVPDETLPENDLPRKREKDSQKRSRDNGDGVQKHVRNQVVSLPPLTKKKCGDPSGGSSGGQNFSSLPGTDETGEAVFTVPHDVAALFSHMQRQIDDLSCEVETLKYDKMVSVSTITALQARINNVYKENDELKSLIKSAESNNE